jgi:hypothetical protein
MTCTITATISETQTFGPTFTATITPENGIAVPAGGGFILYPNPVFDAVHLSYVMKGPGTVKLRIYNEAGGLSAYIEERKPQGAQISSISAGKLAPGVYFCIASLSCDSGSREKSGIMKFIVLR